MELFYLKLLGSTSIIVILVPVVSSVDFCATVYSFGGDAMKSAKVKYPYILTRIFLLLSASIFILYPGTQGYQQIQPAKFSLFLLLFGGYLLLIVLFTVELVAVRRLKLPSGKDVFHRSSMAQRLVVLFWLTTLISTLASPYRAEAIWGMSRNEGLITITIYCGAFLCVSAFGQINRNLILVFGVAMTAFSAIAPGAIRLSCAHRRTCNAALSSIE